MDEVMSQDKLTVQGVLELHPKGFGFLRNPTRHYAAQPADPYVPAPLVQKFRLREGLLIAGPTESARKGNGPRPARATPIAGAPPSRHSRPTWTALTPVAPP